MSMMYNNGYTSAPNQYFPMASPGYPYGQIQPPYVPQQTMPAYTAQTTPQPPQAPRIQMGRVVTNPSEISAQDVSQDGSMTLFPDANGRVIYGRSWQPNGSITETRFVTEQRYWVEAEEWVCNFIADYGMKIFSTAYRIMGDRALTVVPHELERLVA